MNQILCTNLNENFKKEQPSIEKNKVNIFKLQLILSILFVFILGGSVSFYYYHIRAREKLSSRLIQNYNISKLYATNTNAAEENTENNLFGIIEIPSINVYYPIFSTLTDELLKISPCKFYGDSLQENGNICIAGHNYNNSLFFSNLSLLKNNDVIYIYDYSGKKYEYFVYDIYEVKNNDLSPILNYDENSKNLTLITCNNLNHNRLIVTAKQK